jgi:hypothetical protein
MSELHPFERAGLGKAPFRFVGVEVRIGPIRFERNGVTVEIGAPGQPMGACQYCSQGIAECCHVRSSDGRDFIVGNECIKKVDSQLARQAAPAIRERARLMREARQDRKIAAALEALDSVRSQLAAKPHPQPWRAANGATLLDFVEWMLANAGRRGKCEAAALVLEARDGGRS